MDLALASIADLPLARTKPDGLVLFAGAEPCLHLALLAGLSLASPSALLLVDGANFFDPYVIADLAVGAHLEQRGALRRIQVSRVFTCHQLEALATGTLEDAVRRHRAGAVVFGGLLDLLCDEDVPAAEARRVFGRLRATLPRLARRLPVIAACPMPPSSAARAWLLDEVRAFAPWRFAVAEDETGVSIRREAPAARAVHLTPGRRLHGRRR